MVRSEQYDMVRDKVRPDGVATLAKPTTQAAMGQAIEMLCAMRERLRRRRERQASVEEKIEEIRLVNRAKWLLIRELKMDEPEAHRYIEKQSMDRCLPKAAIAKEILQTYA